MSTTSSSEPLHTEYFTGAWRWIQWFFGASPALLMGGLCVYVMATPYQNDETFLLTTIALGLLLIWLTWEYLMVTSPTIRVAYYSDRIEIKTWLRTRTVLFSQLAKGWYGSVYQNPRASSWFPARARVTPYAGASPSRWAQWPAELLVPQWRPAIINDQTRLSFEQTNIPKVLVLDTQNHQRVLTILKEYGKTIDTSRL